ncbi:MAG TPA: LuxR C-terminal-related transcriptional regulator [Limnochordia bacterium]|nr:LuxR C-terminal-related transcriptional regulator [Limnochordia bacterium]
MRRARTAARCADDLRRLAQAPPDVAQLRDRVMDLVAKALAADAISVLNTDPETFLATDGGSRGFDANGAARFFQRVYLQNERLSFLDLRAQKATSSLLSQYTGGDLAVEPRYVEVYRPSGIEHEARACLAVRGAYWGGICLARGRDVADFTADDLRFLEGIAPILAEGLRRAALSAALREGLQTGAGGPDPKLASLLVDRSGRILFASAGAPALLEEIGADPDASGRPAAMPVRSVISAFLGTRTDTLAPGPEVVLQGRSGRWWSVAALPPQTVAGGEAAAAVVIGPARPEQKFSRLATIYALTPRERDVVDAIARGLTTEEAAGELHIRAHTVQDHLKSVFAKTGTDSRRALLARVFHTESPLGRRFAAES